MSAVQGGLYMMMDISTSALKAERARMNVYSNNLANMNTTRNEDGTGPYTRKLVAFKQGDKQITGSNFWGVSVDEILPDYRTEYVKRYDPGHPDADEAGYVTMPNVNVALETVDMMVAARAYQANLTAFEAAKQIHSGALQMIA